MNGLKIFKGIKNTFAWLSGLSFAGASVAFSFDEATALIASLTALVTATVAGITHVIEVIAKVRGWIPMDADVDGQP